MYKPFIDEVQAQQRKTARFVRSAFHVHSIDSHDWGHVKGADPILNGRGQFEGAAGIQAFLDRLAAEFDVVCITDHMKARYACELSKASIRRTDILVLPGMEINCVIHPFPQCIHLLAVFPESTEPAIFDRLFSHHRNKPFPTEAERIGIERFECEVDLALWVKDVEAQGGIVVLAHIDGDNGHRQVVRAAIDKSIKTFVLDSEGVTLEQKQAVSEAYASLLARSGVCAVEIMRPEDRLHYVAFTFDGDKDCRLPCLVRCDAHSIEQFARKECKTHIKLSGRNFRAVRSALDFFETRVRFEDDLPATPFPRICGVRLSSPSGKGLFQSAVIGFSENLNCIIGARGSGKSTLVEALRYVLGANLESVPGMDGEGGYTELARKIQQANLVDTVIQVLYQTGADDYTILEATYDQRVPVATDALDLDGHPLLIGKSALTSAFPARIYSWSELETLGRKREHQRRVLDCFIPGLAPLVESRDEQYLLLAENRAAIIAKCTQLNNRLSEDRGLARKYTEYKAQYGRINTEEVATLFDRLDQSRAKLATLSTTRAKFDELLHTVDTISVSEFESLESTVLAEHAEDTKSWWEANVRPSLLISQLTANIATTIITIREQILTRLTVLNELMTQQRQDVADAEGELREKTQSSPDEELKRGKREQSRLAFEASANKREQYLQNWREFEHLMAQRDELLGKIVQIQGSISEVRKSSLDTVSQRLLDIEELGVKVTIQFNPGGDRAAVVSYMRDGGFLSRTFGQYKDKHLAERFSNMVDPVGIASSILLNDATVLLSEGKQFNSADAATKDEAALLLETFFPFQSDAEASARVVDPGRLNRIFSLQEARWDDEMSIHLDGTPVDKLSPGQRSSAMLPLVALSETVPLIIDQPEDNVDNRLLGRVLTRILSSLKERRQIIVTTHNANIVVGGDAEQVIVAEPIYEGAARIAHTGSIDDPDIVKAVLGIMEGGKEAFELRGRRYQPYLDAQ